MRDRAGIIIKSENRKKILLIKRIRRNKKYWVIPGGGVEQNETFKEAACREIYEEIGIEISVDELSYAFSVIHKEYKEVYYTWVVDEIIDYVICGDEKLRQNDDNQYFVEWISMENLDNMLIYPEELFKYIPSDRKKGCVARNLLV